MMFVHPADSRLSAGLTIILDAIVLDRVLFHQRQSVNKDLLPTDSLPRAVSGEGVGMSTAAKPEVGGTRSIRRLRIRNQRIVDSELLGSCLWT